MATWSHLGFQDSASPLMAQLIFFHNDTMIILIVITSLVGYMMASLSFNVLTNRFLLENETIEMTWLFYQQLS